MQLHECARSWAAPPGPSVPPGVQHGVGEKLPVDGNGGAGRNQCAGRLEATELAAPVALCL
eukprot:5705240-Lingulodinium_polyedra.AAC.1